VMLQILGEVCPALQQLDLWKSARVTELGLRALLGLNSEADESPTGGIISETMENLKKEEARVKVVIVFESEPSIKAVWNCK
jgi:hypothetical protein